MSEPSHERPVAGLSAVVTKAPRRVPIRTRSADVTISAWRLEVTCREGTGAIVLAEPSSVEAHYRGEGLFLGWTQERLSEVWAALLPAGDDDVTDMPQLG